MAGGNEARCRRRSLLPRADTAIGQAITQHPQRRVRPRGEPDEDEDAAAGGHTGPTAPSAALAGRGLGGAAGPGRRVLPGRRLVLLRAAVPAGVERRRQTRRQAHLPPQRGRRGARHRDPWRPGRPRPAAHPGGVGTTVANRLRTGQHDRGPRPGNRHAGLPPVDGSAAGRGGRGSPGQQGVPAESTRGPRHPLPGRHLPGAAGVLPGVAGSRSPRHLGDPDPRQRHGPAGHHQGRPGAASARPAGADDQLPQRRRSATRSKWDAALRLTEWQDLAAAAQYALGHGARRLLLVGYSMGGAIVISFLERSPLAGRVAGVVLDSPMSDFGRAVDHGASRQTLPLVGLPLPQSLTDVAKWVASWRYGVDWPSLDYLRGAAKLQPPILLFQGTTDQTVPAATSDELARLAHDVTYVRVAGADHLDSWNLTPARYNRAVQAFVRRMPRSSAA